MPPLFVHRPTRCPYGHELGPGRVKIGWMPCLCAPAREAADHGRGLGISGCSARRATSRFRLT